MVLLCFTYNFNCEAGVHIIIGICQTTRRLHVPRGYGPLSVRTDHDPDLHPRAHQMSLSRVMIPRAQSPIFRLPVLSKSTLGLVWRSFALHGY